MLQDAQIDKIDAIVGTIEGKWFGYSHFDTEEKKAAAYFCFIIKDHPLVDGNKRLAVLWLQIFCDVMKLQIKLPEQMTLDKLAVSVEAANMNMDDLCNATRTILF